MAAKFLGTALSAIGLYAALKPTSSSKPIGRYGDFISNVRQRGFARTNLFEVVIVPAKNMPCKQGSDKVIHLYADSVNIPGINFATSETRRYGYGPVERKPYAPIFNDITVSFLVDANANIYKYFYKWLNNIVSFDQYVNNNSVSERGLGAFEVDYKDDYKCQLLINTFDEAGNAVLNSQLIDAIPISISDTQFSWSDNDQIMKMNVTFTYFQHVILNTDSREPESGFKKPLSGLQQLIKAGTALQTLSSLRKPKSVGDVINVINNAKVITGGYGGG